MFVWNLLLLAAVLITQVCVCRDGVGVTWVSKTAVLSLPLILNAKLDKLICSLELNGFTWVCNQNANFKC